MSRQRCSADVNDVKRRRWSDCFIRLVSDCRKRMAGGDQSKFTLATFHWCWPVITCSAYISKKKFKPYPCFMNLILLKYGGFDDESLHFWWDIPAFPVHSQAGLLSGEYYSIYIIFDECRKMNSGTWCLEFRSYCPGRISKQLMSNAAGVGCSA